MSSGGSKSGLAKFALHSFGARAFAVILVVYVLLFNWMACRRFEACATQSGDTAELDYAYYSTLHGKLFWSFHLDNSCFETHAEPLVLLFVPVYFLCPGVKTLILLHTLCIAVASVPIYLLGRKVLGHDAAGLLMAVAFLFFPSLVSQNIDQVHTTGFPLPFLMFAFYFFEEDKFVPFLIAAGLASLGKETAPLTALMFAPYALWRRRSWKWIAASFAVPVAALVLSLGVIRPHFARGQSYIALQYYPGFGNSLVEFARTVLSRPDKVATALFTGRNGVYLLLLLTPVGLVAPFLVPAAIFVLPELFLNLLSSNDGQKVVIWLYNVNTGAFLIVATMYTLAKTDRFLQARLGGGKYGPVLAGCVAILCISNWWQWMSPNDYQLDRAHRARQQAFAKIPKDDSLLAGPGQVLAHVTHRQVLACPKMIRQKPDQMFLYNWVFFDMNHQTPILGLHVPRELFMAFASNSQYETVFAQENVFVFRRKDPFPAAQVPPIRYTSDAPLPAQ